MKLGCFATVALLTASLAAAQEHAKNQTRVIVRDGKEITVSGCVQRNPNGEYTLINAAGKDGAAGSYILAQAGDDDDKLEDLDKHVGHRMEISGKAANRGDGKIEFETKSEMKKSDGGTAKTVSKSEVKGDLDELPFLGVKSARMIASVCQ
jgi:hypothetical protein